MSDEDCTEVWRIWGTVLRSGGLGGLHRDLKDWRGTTLRPGGLEKGLHWVLEECYGTTLGSGGVVRTVLVTKVLEGGSTTQVDASSDSDYDSWEV